MSYDDLYKLWLQFHRGEIGLLELETRMFILTLDAKELASIAEEIG